MLEVAKHAARFKNGKDFLVERELARITEMMNCKTGEDGIESAQRWQGLLQIMVEHGNRWVVGKACTGGRQHDGREIKSYSLRLRSAMFHQRYQPPIAGAQVQDPPDV